MKTSYIVNQRIKFLELAKEYLYLKLGLDKITNEFFEFVVSDISKVNKDSKLYRLEVDAIDGDWEFLDAYHFDADPKELDGFIMAKQKGTEPVVEILTPDALIKNTGSISEALGLPEGSVALLDDDEDCDCINCKPPLSQLN